MSYNDLIQKEGINQQFLIVLRPGRVQSSWTSLGGTSYKASFDYGHISKVTSDGVGLTEVFTNTPSTDEWYWDYDNEELYVNITSIATKTVTIFYELYYTTAIGTHWYRVPTDNTTREVFFDPIVIKSPVFKQSVSQSLFGFVPSQSSNVILGNADHQFEHHVYDSSFKNKDIWVYHWISDLETANIKLLYKASMSNVTYTPERITISVNDKIDFFNKNFRSVVEFYLTSVFSNLDPNHEGSAVRSVWGRVEDALMVNLDYEVENPSNSNNRSWAAREGTLNQVTRTVPASPVSTTTRTYLDSVAGLVEGDSVKFVKGVTEYSYITTVDRTSTYIEHPTLTAACVNGDTVVRPTFSVFIEQQGIKYRALFDRDYTEMTLNGVAGVTLTANAEVNLGINTLDGSELVFAHMYGKDDNITAITSSDSTIYNVMCNPVAILYDLMVNYAGVDASDIDTASFNTLSSSIGAQDMGLSIPVDSIGIYPSYKTLITKLSQSCLMILFLNDENKWEVDVIEPLTSEDVSIEVDEILKGSINYSFNYNDIISDIIVSYRHKEKTQRSEKELYTSSTAKYLHELSTEKEFETYVLNQSDAATLAKRLSFIFGDRVGEFRFKCKNRFFDNYISDTIEVTLEKLPGFEYVEGSTNNRNFDILDIDKSLNNVTRTCNDQKGLDDNSSSY